MTQKEIQDAIISDMVKGKAYAKDYYITSFARSKEIAESDVVDALEAISSNIVAQSTDVNGVEYICKLREPMP